MTEILVLMKHDNITIQIDMAVVRLVGHAAARLARTRVAPSASYTLDGVCQSTCLFRRRQISAGIEQ